MHNKIIFYSYVFDRKLGAILATNPASLPFGKFFITNQKGHILEDDCAGLEEKKKERLGEALGSLDLFGGAGFF